MYTQHTVLVGQKITKHRDRKQLCIVKETQLFNKANLK